MRNFLHAILLVLSLMFLGAEATLGQKQLTVEDIYENPELRGRSFAGVQWMPDGSGFTYFQPDANEKELIIWRYEIKSQQKQPFLTSKQIPVLQSPRQEKRFTLGNYIWSPDYESVLFPTAQDLHLYSVSRRQLRRLTHDMQEERDPIFSPDGKMLAYLKNDNIYVLDITSGTEKQLTKEGGGSILIGRFDWVYEEEFGIRTGFAWSPDGKAIAFWRLDESRVPEFPIADFIPVHNAAPVMRYPKAGDVNSTVKVGVVDIETGAITWMDIGSETDIYIPRIQWTQDPNLLCITRLNRDQNHLQLLLADRRTGKSNDLFEEREYAGWIEITDDLQFLQDKKHFIWTSRKTGWKHIYLVELATGLMKPVTSGEWDVDQIVEVDEKRKKIYYTSGHENPLERHLYVVNFNGKGTMQLTRRPGTHRILMSPAFNYFIDTYSDVNTPWTVTLRRMNGARHAFLERNPMPALQTFQLPPTEFLTVPAADSTTMLNAFMIKPVDFDPQKKYPVLIYNYSGPGSQIVRNQWGGDRYLWHAMLAQRGYIVFGVDNHGTGARGKAFMMATYKNLGDLESQDQMAAAKWLAQQPYVDGSRIGIWGWSYGGYITALTFLKSGGLFKVGMAVAPVTDWRNYDTIYTERYMLTPEKNPGGYERSSCLKYVDRLTGYLLLIHGTADDNVHLSNTMQLAYALQNARKPFDLMLYPRKLHGIRGTDTRIHLFKLMTAYLEAHL